MKKNTSKKSCNNNSVIITAIVSGVIVVGFGLLFYFTQKDVNKGLVTENDFMPVQSKVKAIKPVAQTQSTVTIREDSDLGVILVAANVMTLYVSSDDEIGVSNCDKTCAEDWLPLTTDGNLIAGSGATGTLAIISDTKQVTYNGQPLYFWANDNAPGDANGETKTWSVAKP